MKKIGFYILLLVIIGVMFFITFMFQSKTTYVLHVPDEITEISVNDLLITDEKKFNEVKQIFDKKIVTKMDSVQDGPVNYDELFTVSLNGEMVYVYRRGHRYYFEQPYNGVYKINKSIFLKIKENGD